MHLAVFRRNKYIVLPYGATFALLQKVVNDFIFLLWNIIPLLSCYDMVNSIIILAMHTLWLAYVNLIYCIFEVKTNICPIPWNRCHLSVYHIVYEMMVGNVQQLYNYQRNIFMHRSIEYVPGGWILYREVKGNIRRWQPWPFSFFTNCAHVT